MLSAASSRTSQPDVVELPTGLLRVEVNEAAWPLDPCAALQPATTPSAAS
jgi:hypothetical protein